MTQREWKPTVARTVGYVAAPVIGAYAFAGYLVHFREHPWLAAGAALFLLGLILLGPATLVSHRWPALQPELRWDDTSVTWEVTYRQRALVQVSLCAILLGFGTLMLLDPGDPRRYTPWMAQIAGACLICWAVLLIAVPRPKLVEVQITRGRVNYESYGPIALTNIVVDEAEVKRFAPSKRFLELGWQLDLWGTAVEHRYRFDKAHTAKSNEQSSIPVPDFRNVTPAEAETLIRTTLGKPDPWWTRR